MPLDRKYYIHTGKDGSLEASGLDYDFTDVDMLVAGLATTPRVALTIHGGLVPPDHALVMAEKLLPLYQQTGIHPVFFIWESGLLTSLQNLLKEVWTEGLFQSL